MTPSTPRIPRVRGRIAAAAVGIVFSPAFLHAQEPPPTHGKVVIASSEDPAVGPPVSATAPDSFPKPLVTNEERTAVFIVSDDLDLHLTPSASREEAHAILTLRNGSSQPISRIPLQITSTLRWQSIFALTAHRSVAFTQSPVTTDADHTGYAQEAVLTLDRPLASGNTLTVSVVFSGEISRTTDRLTLIGTPPVKAAETDWDAIVPTSDEESTALRGFGDVLWYPVAAPTAVFGEGNQLFEAVARQRRLNTSSTIRLRLKVLYAGDPPDAAIFDGQLQSLTRTPDESDQVIDESKGVATADFPWATIGLRTPNLFLTGQHPSIPGSALLSVVSPVPEAAEPYATAAQNLAPLLEEWFAPTPLTPLLLLEHPGHPFEDHAFIAAHLSATAPPEGIAPEIVRGLTHAFFATSEPTSQWLDQGLPEFMSLLWTERTAGRATAMDQLQQNALALLLAEPDLAQHPELPGTPLTEAATDVYLHFKAASVLWQLRELVGPDLLRLAIANYRHALQLNPALDRDPAAFEKSIEKTCTRDLAWFFDDWVYHDRSLPDLTIEEVHPRPILAPGGRSGGYLVPVEVHNDGYAAAQVPVTVRAGDVTASAQLLIPGRSVASVRIVFEGVPETVQVNDGSVPELRASTHTVHIAVKPN